MFLPFHHKPNVICIQEEGKKENLDNLIVFLKNAHTLPILIGSERKMTTAKLPAVEDRSELHMECAVWCL